MLQLKYCRKNDIVFSNNLFGGGKTLVEQSNERIGRDPVALKSISKKTGVNVIMGCGYYKDEWMPCDVKDKTIEDIVCNASISVQRMAVEAAVQGDDLLLRQVMMMDSVNYINNWEKVHSLEIRAADYIKVFSKLHDFFAKIYV